MRDISLTGERRKELNHTTAREPVLYNSSITLWTTRIGAGQLTYTIPVSCDGYGIHFFPVFEDNRFRKVA
jgi:hypothetical protein